jgi:hypothetical protein
VGYRLQVVLLVVHLAVLLVVHLAVHLLHWLLPDSQLVST